MNINTPITTELTFGDFENIVDQLNLNSLSHRSEKAKLKLKKSLKGKKEKNAIHIVTYELRERRGYMMLSASRKANPLLAYGELKNFDDLDINNLEKPGLSDWLDNNITYIEEEEGKENFDDEVIGQLLFGVIAPPGGGGIGGEDENGDNDGDTECGEYVEFTYGPLLNTWWDQRHPYNMQVPVNCNDEWNEL